MGSSTMMDFIGSAIIFGVLIFTVGRVQVNLNSTMYYNTYTYMTQNFALEMSKMIEFDFNKMGYQVTGATAKVDTADTNKIRFKYYFPRTGGSLRTIRYALGEADTTTRNPRDYVLYRTENGVTVNHRIGLTEFRLAYYDSLHRRLATPITGTRTDSIYAIGVYYRVESFEPIIMPDVTQYISVIWEKLIYPRNLKAIR
jgi:hypothetical protein